MITLNTPYLEGLIVKRNPELLFTGLDEETVILDIESGFYNSLNEVGTTIWNLLEQSTSIGTLKNHILQTYEITETQCLEDLIFFLNQLNSQNLLVFHHAATG
ncbi:MAG: PqqD family protein [Proteobacteria bacterium]|nr:PqqD family protein [Pseudomonadota bacterium]